MLSDEDFTTVMIVTMSGMLVLGIFLLLCLVRYPSYDYIENLIRDQKLFRHEWDSNVNLRNGDEMNDLEKSRSSFLPPLATPFIEIATKSGKIRKMRLPKRTEQPDTHLPPLGYSQISRSRRSGGSKEDVEATATVSGSTRSSSRDDVDSIDKAIARRAEERKNSRTSSSIQGGRGVHRKSTSTSRRSTGRVSTTTSRISRKHTTSVRFKDEVVLDVANLD